MIFAARTDVGRRRDNNEDGFFTGDFYAGVCDGMGGAAAGEVASQLAVTVVQHDLAAAARSPQKMGASLIHALESANLRIFSEAKRDRTRRGMGTTATVAAFVADHLFLGQVGDSRAYILRGERLVQVTRDQSLVNQLIEAGQLTKEEARGSACNNVILQALGTANSIQVDLTYVQLCWGDMLLLCSDGLSDMVRDDEIGVALGLALDPIHACHDLVDLANQAGGKDNTTVVLVVFDDQHLPMPTRKDIDNLKYQKHHPSLLIREGVLTAAARLAKGKST